MQTTFEVLLASGEEYDLARVDYLDYETLALWVRKTNNPRLAARVKRLAHYDKKDIMGYKRI